MNYKRLKRHSSGATRFHNGNLAKPSYLMAKQRSPLSTMAKFQISQHMGFGVRKWTQYKKADGTTIWKRFVCSKEGWRKEQESGEDEKPKRKVKITRCGCEAMIGLKRRDDGKYVVATFISYHTHDLVSPRMRHLIKSNREVTSVNWDFCSIPYAQCRERWACKPRLHKEGCSEL